MPGSSPCPNDSARQYSQSTQGKKAARRAQLRTEKRTPTTVSEDVGKDEKIQGSIFRGIGENTSCTITKNVNFPCIFNHTFYFKKELALTCFSSSVLPSAGLESYFSGYQALSGDIFGCHS